MGIFSEEDNPAESERWHERAKHSDEELLSIHNRLMYERSRPFASGFPWSPLLIVGTLSLLVFWAGIYVIRYSGGFRWDVYDGKVDPATVGMESGPVVFDPMKAGEKFFKRNCLVCHQSNGMGVPGAFPPLVASNWVQGSEERLAKILLQGMQGEIVVNGTEYNGAMPGFSHASDRDIAAVLTWIRTNEWGNNAGEISEEYVASVRAATLSQTQAWSGPELMSEYQ